MSYCYLNVYEYCLIDFFGLISGQAIVGECFSEFTLLLKCILSILQKTVPHRTVLHHTTSRSTSFSIIINFVNPSFCIYFNYLLCVEPVVRVILEDSVRRNIRLEVSVTGAIS